MLPGVTPKSHSVVFYAYTGLAFLLWENLISSAIGLYDLELRRTFWGIIWYVAVFLLFGLAAEGLRLITSLLFPKSIWSRQRYVWLLAVLFMFLWGDLYQRILSLISMSSSFHLNSAYRSLIWIFLIIAIACGVNFIFSRAEKAGRLPSPARLTFTFATAVLYLLLSTKITHRYLYSPHDILTGLYLQPIYILLSVVAIWLIGRFAISQKSFNRAIIAVPIVLTVAVVLITHYNPFNSRVHTAPAASSTNRPNVIIMLFDSMREDQVGLNYGKSSLTPFIDSLGQQGRAYTDCYAPSSWTFPSVVSLLTSRLPDELGLLTAHVLPDTMPTFTQILSRHGYHTIGISSNELYVSDALGFGRKFDEFHQLLGVGVKQLLLPLPSFFNSPSYMDEVAYQFGFSTTDDIVGDWRKGNKLATSALAKNASNPFFMYIHYWEPHFPYTTHPFEGILNFRMMKLVNDQNKYKVLASPSKENNQALREELFRRYRDGVRTADHAVYEMIKTLTQLGLAENTILIIMADHGEEFIEHGRWGHQESLYNELVHIPLIIYAPKNLGINLPEHPEGVTSLDVAPTVLDLAGINEGIPCSEGLSLLNPYPALERPRIMMLDCRGTLWGAIVSNPYKVILRRNAEKGWLDTLLFDLRSDPGEKNNLFTQQKTLADSLALFLRERMETTTIHTSERKPRKREWELNLERLKAVGYVN